MSSRVIRRSGVFWLVAAILTAMIMLAACGGPADQESGQQQETSSNGGNPANGGNTAAANRSPSEGAGSGGSQSNRAEDPAKQPSSGSAITGYDVCESYSSWLSLSGGAGFSYQSGDGTRVDSSKTPPSDFAAEVAKFTEDSLEDVLDGDVSAACFIESKASNYGSVYVALSIPGDPPSGVASDVGEAMKKRGANVLGSFSSTSPEGTYDIVTLQGVPVEVPNDLLATGALYFITTQEGVFQAVMVVSYTDTGAQVSSGSASVPGAPSGTQAPFRAPAVTPVTPSGTAGSINDDLKPALEKALGRHLIVETFFQSSAGGNNTGSISYVIDGHLPSGVEPSAALSAVVEELGGTVSFAFSSADGTSVLFEGMKAGDFSVGGAFTYIPNTGQVALTFTSVDAQ